MGLTFDRYRKQGQVDEARELLKPFIKDALAILFDDDPTNDMEGYADLGSAFLITGDDMNCLAVYHSQREYNDGVTVLKDGESPIGGDQVQVDIVAGEAGEDAKEGDETSDGVDMEPDEDDGTVGECDGICGNPFNNWDGVRWCRYCGWCFCEECFQLLQDGELPLNICGAHHDFLLVPRLKQKFKEGELLVGDQVMSADEWKAGIKKQWGL